VVVEDGTTVATEVLGCGGAVTEELPAAVAPVEEGTDLTAAFSFSTTAFSFFSFSRLEEDGFVALEVPE